MGIGPTRDEQEEGMSDENDSKTNIYSHGYVSMQKEISDLRTRLEDYRDMVAKYQAENAALKQKLEEARGWVKLYDPDWDNDINKLKKILDGE